MGKKCGEIEITFYGGEIREVKKEKERENKKKESD